MQDARTHSQGLPRQMVKPYSSKVLQCSSPLFPTCSILMCAIPRYVTLDRKLMSSHELSPSFLPHVFHMSSTLLPHVFLSTPMRIPHYYLMLA